MRTNQWLLSRLNEIWERSYADVAQLNPVHIVFGRRAKYRFGSVQLKQFGAISSNKQSTMITINGLFREESVPQEVVDYTIAHELAHYVHGFSSPHKRRFRHPHKRGVVTKELQERGLGYLTKTYRAWLKEYRKKLTAKSFGALQ